MLVNDGQNQIKQYRRSYHGSHPTEISKFIERVSMDLFKKLPEGAEFTPAVLGKVLDKYGIRSEISIQVAVVDHIMRVIVELPVRLNSAQFNGIKTIIQNGRSAMVTSTTTINGTSIKVQASMPKAQTVQQLIENVNKLNEDDKWKNLGDGLEDGSASELTLMALDYAHGLIGLDTQKFLELNEKVRDLVESCLSRGVLNDAHIVLRPNVERTKRGNNNSLVVVPHIDIVVVADRFLIEKYRYSEYRDMLRNLVKQYITLIDDNNFLEEESEQDDKYVFFNFGCKDLNKGKQLMQIEGSKRVLSDEEPAKTGTFCMLKDHQQSDGSGI